jgi:hypothetical protein
MEEVAASVHLHSRPTQHDTVIGVANLAPTSTSGVYRGNKH